MKIESNGSGGVKVELEKAVKEGRTSEIGESAYVNLSTEANITFSKGIVLSRELVYKPMPSAAVNL